MGHKANLHFGVTLVLTASLALALVGCTSSPKSTYVAASGENVTVDWRDYPGQSGVDAGQALLAPSAEQTRAQSSAILGEIESRLSAEFGLAWENGPRGTEQRVDGDFYASDGNGYGGDSLYVTFNSESRESLSIPSGPGDWQRIIDIIADVTISHGLGNLNSDGLADQLSPEEAEQLGPGGLDEYWQWGGTAYGQSQWLSVSLGDVTRDATGKALRDMKGSIEYGWNPRAVTISYGATVLPATDRLSFVERVTPFEGLARPAATTSD